MSIVNESDTTTTYEYNGSTVTSLVVEGSDGSTYSLVESEYDENGSLQSITEYDEDGNVISHTVVTFDENTGKVSELLVYDGNDELIQDVTYEYSMINGSPALVTYTSTDVTTQVTECIDQGYDAQGNVTQYYIDVECDGAVDSVVEYSYDANGNQALFYGEDEDNDGNMIQYQSVITMEIAWIRVEFDSGADGIFEIVQYSCNVTPDAPTKEIRWCAQTSSIKNATNQRLGDLGKSPFAFPLFQNGTSFVDP